MSDLHHYSDEKLREELSRREEERRRAAEVAKLAKAAAIKVALDTPDGMALLQLLMPDHSRTSCKGPASYTDENVGRCDRCTILYTVENQDFINLSKYRLTW